MQGIAGVRAKQLARDLSGVRVAFDVAQTVFYRCTVPQFARRTLEVYPRVDRLPPDAQAMVLSLIYNRGTRLTGPHRQHLAALKPVIARGDLEEIAGQFELMTELWPDLPGLCTRRRKEAALIRGADRRYGDDEIVRV